jgi:histone H3/H4
MFQPSNNRKKIMTYEKINEKPEKLPFAKNEVTRLMRKHLDDDKMIRDQVKVEMNKFLHSVLISVCKRLNEYPYTTIEYEMLKECIYPYKNIERINEEKQRILMHLDAIKADCDALAMDVEKSLRLTDTPERDTFADFTLDGGE